MSNIVGGKPMGMAVTPPSFTVGTLYAPIRKKLMGRAATDDDLAEAIRKGVLELTESFKFPLLQTTGPIVSFTPGISNYFTGYFTTPGDGGIEINKVEGFYVYLNPFVPLANVGSTGSNPGYNLTFRTIKNMEVLINTLSLPIHWSRFENHLWFGGTPDRAYNVYMRYQHEHPFPSAGTSSAGDDPILLPNSWQDICEYMAAMRYAQDFNLSGKVTELHTRLYGDSKFQSSGGIEGSPGLIFQRTSQENRDQSTTTKRLRLRMGRV